VLYNLLFKQRSSIQKKEIKIQEWQFFISWNKNLRNQSIPSYKYDQQNWLWSIKLQHYGGSRRKPSIIKASKTKFRNRKFLRSERFEAILVDRLCCLSRCKRHLVSHPFIKEKQTPLHQRPQQEWLLPILFRSWQEKQQGNHTSSEERLFLAAYLLYSGQDD